MRTPLLIVVTLVLVLALIACGPATQPEPGNLTLPSPLSEAPAPTLIPTTAVNAQQEEEPTPTPTPTPMPTACVTFEDDQGNTTDICFTQPTPYPDQFDKLDTRIVYAVIESEERTDSPGGASDEDVETLWVRIEYEGGDNGTAIVKWLADREIAYDLYADVFVIEAFIPPGAAIPISELQGVLAIRTVQIMPHTGE